MATATVGPSKDHATVTAWEAAVQGTLTEKEIAQVYTNTSDAAYTDAPVIAGSTTTASFNMRVEVFAGEEFNFDTASPSGARWDRNSSGHAWQVTDAHFELVGPFGITNSTTASSDEGIRVNSGGTPLHVEKVCIYELTTSDCDGIYVGNQDQDLTVKDCAFVNIHRAGVHFQHPSGGPYTQTATLVNLSGSGMGSGGGGTNEGALVGYRCNNAGSTLDVEIINCFAVNAQGTVTKSVGPTSGGSGTVTITGDYCADEEADQASSGFPDDGGNSIFNTSAKRRADLTTETSTHLVVETWDDLHIVDDTSETYTNALQGGGIGPASEGEVPTTDIDGDTRSGTTTDIGCDVIASATAAGHDYLAAATTRLLRQQRLRM